MSNFGIIPYQKPPLVPLAHTFDRYGGNLVSYTPTPATVYPLQYMPDSVGKQTRPIQLGRCYGPDGVDDVVTFPHSALLASNNVELEFWFIPTNVATFKPTFLQVQANTTAGSTGGWYMDASASGAANGLRISLYTSNGANSENFALTTSLVNGTTYQVKVRLTPNGPSLTTVTTTVTPLNGTPSTVIYNMVSALIFPTTGSTKLNLYAAKIWGFKITNNATGAPILFAKCDEQAGTISYDSSGNGLHGTITNATQSTFHSTQSVYSWQNEVGYNNSGQLYFEDFTSYGVIAASTANRSIGGWNFTGVGTTTSEITALGQLLIKEPSTTTTVNVYIQKSFAIAKPGWYRMRCKVTNPGQTSNIYWRWEGYGAQVNAQTGTVDVVAQLPAGTQFINIIPQGFGYQLTIDSFELTHLTFIPRNEATPTLDVLGTALAYSGRVKYNALLKQSFCATFSGAQTVTMPLPVTTYTNIEIEFYARPTAASCGFFSFASDNSGSNQIGIGAWQTAGLGFEVKIGASTPLSFQSLTLNTWTKVKIVHNAGTVSLYYNDVLVKSVSATVTLTGSTFLLGRGYMATTSVYCTGQIAGFSVKDLTSGNLIASYPLAEGADSRAYDVSGNAYHGTVTNATLATFWGTKQDYLHWNLLVGNNKPTFYSTGFDSGSTGWSAGVSMTGATTGTQSVVQDSGNNVLQTVRTTDQVIFARYTGLTVVPGLLYRYSFRIKLTVCGGVNQALFFRHKIGQSLNTVGNSTVVSVAAGWTTISATFTAVDTTGFGVGATGEGGNGPTTAGDTFLIDDVVISQEVTIPARPDNPALDAAGNTTQNRPKPRALIPSETLIDFTGAVASPFAVIYALPATFAYGNTFQTGNKYADASGSKNFLVYPTITADQLLKIKNYLKQ